MALKEEVFAKALEGIIDRLDEAKTNALIPRDTSSADFEGIDEGNNRKGDTEEIEEAIFELESRIDELTQVMEEEIDNLRTVLENLEEDL
jgi:hypothetical protein